ncbi:MAG: DUF4339 domain-containing protein, partial [Planctomycetes bacterium]|nr:DUF4339 domain-containing protein [Planctomycetota bacterium]
EENGISESPAAQAASQEMWHFARDGKQLGPFDVESFRQMMSRGEIGPRDVVWKKGMESWIPAEDLPEFRFAFSSNSIAAQNSGKMCGISIASFVLGLLWLGGLGSILAIIFGLISRAKIKGARGALRGGPLAAWGVSLGFLFFPLLGCEVGEWRRRDGSSDESRLSTKEYFT